MLASENPAGWCFGDLRGGILGDEPGLGKTVTVMALIAHTAGALPQAPADFYGGFEDWLVERENPELHRRILKHVLSPLRKAFEKALQDAMHRAGIQGVNQPMQVAEDNWVVAANALQPASQFDSLPAFEAAVHRCVRVGCQAVATLCPRGMAMRMQKQLRETARGGVNELRAGLDKRGRSLFKSARGRRMIFERKLLPVPATLIVVPGPSSSRIG